MEPEKKTEAPPVIEFFITYGWAILVILVGLGIFIYFGLINIEGDTCKIAPKLKCKEFSVEEDKVILTIENKMDQLLLGIDVTVEGCSDIDKGNILDKEKEETFIITGCNNKVGEEFNNKINFTYIAEDGKTYSKIGKIIKTVT